MVSLLFPLLGVVLIWLWVGEMNLLQNPGTSLAFIGVGVVCTSALLVLLDAQAIGVGVKEGESSPAVWALAVGLIWVIAFPLYMYRRSRNGVPNLLAAGALVTVAFTGSWIAMQVAIESKKAEVRAHLAGLAGPGEYREEAEAHLNRLARNALAYFQDNGEYPPSPGRPLPNGAPCGSKFSAVENVAAWDSDETWSSLGFRVEQDGNLQYIYSRPKTDSYGVIAVPNLNCGQDPVNGWMLVGIGEKFSVEPFAAPRSQLVEGETKSAGSHSASQVAPNLDFEGLDPKAKSLFEKLLASLSSPCSKSHSLGTSIDSDRTCKRAPFAGRYVASMVEDELSENEVREYYLAIYGQDAPKHNFKLDGVPHDGLPDAPVIFVEFFDYGCPTCRQFKPALEKTLAEAGTQAVVYYKQFPLVSAHPDSMSAAQAALAAHAQGKFKQMHDKLFAVSAHKRSDVTRYAQELGLDPSKFAIDYAKAETIIKAEIAEGEAAGVDHAPTLYLNGREYRGPMHPRYLGLSIAEEIAVSK